MDSARTPLVAGEEKSERKSRSPGTNRLSVASTRRSDGVIPLAVPINGMKYCSNSHCPAQQWDKSAEYHDSVDVCPDCGASYELIKSNDGFAIRPAQSVGEDWGE